jgi:hypothetical protein
LRDRILRDRWVSPEFLPGEDAWNDPPIGGAFLLDRVSLSLYELDKPPSWMEKSVACTGRLRGIPVQIPFRDLLLFCLSDSSQRTGKILKVFERNGLCSTSYMRLTNLKLFASAAAALTACVASVPGHK